MTDGKGVRDVANVGGVAGRQGRWGRQGCSRMSGTLQGVRDVAGNFGHLSAKAPRKQTWWTQHPQKLNVWSLKYVDSSAKATSDYNESQKAKAFSTPAVPAQNVPVPCGWFDQFWGAHGVFKEAGWIRKVEGSSRLWTRYLAFGKWWKV